MRKGKKAAEWALLRVKSEAWPRMCKQFVRLAFDIPSKSGSARECFAKARFKHTPNNINDTPAFVPAFFDTGPFGHAVLTLAKDKQGRRLCISVDVKDTDHDTRREVGVVPLESLLRWGPFQGWTEDFDGVRVYDRPTPKPGPPKKPVTTKVDQSIEVTPPKRKSVEEIAREVIAGKWGNGEDRRTRLQKAGYGYAAVQTKVTELMHG